MTSNNDSGPGSNSDAASSTDGSGSGDAGAVDSAPSPIDFTIPYAHGTPASGPSSCSARDCGTDGAAGSCGTCGATFACDTTLGLCIPNNGQDVGVTFQGGCWYLCPQGATYCIPGRRYQSVQFQLQASYPIEGTLYFNRYCNPVNGTDNLNDTGAATPQNIGLESFVHHPDEVPSSAVWWFGHHSTGCIDYTTVPDC